MASACKERLRSGGSPARQLPQLLVLLLHRPNCPPPTSAASSSAVVRLVDRACGSRNAATQLPVGVGQGGVECTA